MKRHYWSEPVRPDPHHTFRRCWDCTLIRITRHEGERHWIEWRKNGERIASERTPACEPVEVKAA